RRRTARTGNGEIVKRKAAAALGRILGRQREVGGGDRPETVMARPRSQIVADVDAKIFDGVVEPLARRQCQPLLPAIGFVGSMQEGGVLAQAESHGDVPCAGTAPAGRQNRKTGRFCMVLRDPGLRRERFCRLPLVSDGYSLRIPIIVYICIVYQTDSRRVHGWQRKSTKSVGCPRAGRRRRRQLQKGVSDRVVCTTADTNS